MPRPLRLALVCIATTLLWSHATYAEQKNGLKTTAGASKDLVTLGIQIGQKLPECVTKVKRPDRSVSFTIRIKLKPDATLDGRPEVIDRRTDAAFALAAKAAVDAITCTGKDGFNLSPETYDSWKTVDIPINFVGAAGVKPAVKGVPVARHFEDIMKRISDKLKPCWDVPKSAKSGPVVRVKWTLRPDSTLEADPIVVSGSEHAEFAKAALTAVRCASPFGLPAEHYKIWKTLTWDFDPRTM